MFNFFKKDKEKTPVGRVYSKQLSEDEQISIKAQNQLLKFYFERVYKIPVFEISRDKQGHALIFTTPNNYTMDAYTIGINNKTHQLVPFQIGTSELQFNYGGSKISCSIDRLGIHSAFRGTGTGSVMLQAIENYFCEKDQFKIYLEALRNYVDISENPMSVEQVKSSMTQEEAEQYIKNNFIDRNLYFYSSSGYVKTGGNCNEHTVQMQKANIQKVDLSCGLEKPLKLSDHKDQYPVCVQFLDALKQAETSTTKNFFVESHNKFPAEEFSPLEFNPTLEDFSNFYNVATHFKPIESSFQDRFYRLDIPVQEYSKELSNLTLLSKVSESMQPASTIHTKELMALHDDCVAKINKLKSQTETQLQ